MVAKVDLWMGDHPYISSYLRFLKSTFSQIPELSFVKILACSCVAGEIFTPHLPRPKHLEEAKGMRGGLSYVNGQSKSVP